MNKKIILWSIAGIIILTAAIFIVIKNNTNANYSSLTCEILKKGGEGKVNLVFITKEPKEKITKYLEEFNKINPINEEIEKFNFYYIQENPECELKYNAVLCYSRRLIGIASNCPNDFIIAIEDKSPEIRSSAYMNVISVNLNHNPNVVMHEFGHVFANLADEYVPANIPRGSKNCKSKELFEENFLGCSKENYYRSSPASIMRTLSSNSYDLFNENVIKQTIAKY